MAQMLRSKDSSKGYVSASRRVRRGLKLLPDWKTYSDMLEPSEAALAEFAQAAEDAKQHATDFRVDLAQGESRLYDKAKAINEQAGQYDRNNLGSASQKMLFPPKGNLTDLPRKGEGLVNGALVLVNRLDTLSLDHPLLQFRDPLYAQVQTCKLLQTQITEAEADQKKTRALELVAQQALSKSYEEAYSEVVKKYGRKVADEIFRYTKSYRKPAQQPSEQPTQESAADPQPELSNGGPNNAQGVDPAVLHLASQLLQMLGAQGAAVLQRVEVRTTTEPSGNGATMPIIPPPHSLPASS